MREQMCPSPIDTTGTPQSEKRGRQACTVCNKRKVRCDLGSVASGGPCSNCRFHGVECIPHQRTKHRRRLRMHEKHGHKPDNTTPHSPTEQDLQSLLTPTEDGNPAVSLPGLPPPTASPPYNLAQQSPSSSLGNDIAYVGRPEYLPGEFTTGGNSGRDFVPKSSVPEVDREFLRLFKAFELPPRAVRGGLISNFLTYCSPWMPVADVEDLQMPDAQNVADPHSRTSLLLAQAVFLAGSRVPSSRLPCANSANFYNRAKALFFADFEPDPLKTLSALCLMQWYNPSGPEHVSIHSGGFWLRVAVALAYQVGLHREPSPRSPQCKLRRRLFWSLFCRDCILFVAHGRPRAVNLDDCRISLPTVADFPTPTKNAHVFVAYVDICSILAQCGQIANGCSPQSARIEAGRNLHRWIRELPAMLKLDNAVDYDFEVRQLYLIYFTTVSILYGPVRCGRRASVAPILASSCVARIFEDFLVRDQLRYMGAIGVFHLRVAALPQIWCYNSDPLCELSKAELSIIRSSLQEMGKTWHSAKRALRILTSFVSTAMRGQQMNQPLEDLDTTAEQLSFFETIPLELCPKWRLIVESAAGNLLKAQQQPQSASVSTTRLERHPFFTDLDNNNPNSGTCTIAVGAEIDMGNLSAPTAADSSRMPTVNALLSSRGLQQTSVDQMAAGRFVPNFVETDRIVIADDGLQHQNGTNDEFFGGIFPEFNEGFLQDWEGAFL